ncbi:Uncharacterized protein LB4E_3295 [Leptospira borgpetersenii str. 4E]|nr:Uncharacterized protein LB4E_3295 [Leptospira borgpetersenii str. 4E]
MFQQLYFMELFF